MPSHESGHTGLLRKTTLIEQQSRAAERQARTVERIEIIVHRSGAAAGPNAMEEEPITASQKKKKKKKKKKFNKNFKKKKKKTEL